MFAAECAHSRVVPSAFVNKPIRNTAGRGMQQARTISGTIRFQNVTRSSQSVTVYVRLDETSRADAAASRLAEVVLHGVSIFPGSPHLGFTMRVSVPRASGCYSV